MPSRPPRPCRRCYRLPVPGTPFCQEHQQPVGWEKHQRGRTSTERGYGAQWRRLRAQVLSEEPTCRLCAEQGLTVASTTVDHVIPKAKGGTDGRGNLRGICSDCHHVKTGRDRLHPGLKPHRDLVRTPAQTTRESPDFESLIRRFDGD